MKVDLFSILKSAAQVGATGWQHHNIIKQAANMPAESGATEIQRYLQGLSDQSFLGFKAILRVEANRQADPVQKAKLAHLLSSADAVRQGQSVAIESVALADTAPLANDDGFDVDSTLLEKWHKLHDEGAREIAIRDHFDGLSPQRYSQLITNLHQMANNVEIDLKNHTEYYHTGGFRYMEDRMQHKLNNLSRGGPDKDWIARQYYLGGLRDLVQVILSQYGQ